MENGRHPSSRGKRRCKRRLRPQGLGISKLGHGRRRGRPDWRRCRAEVGRQHLYVALTGPWASRVLIVRKLKGPSSQASLGAGTAAARINIAPLGVLFGAALDAPRLSPHLLRNRPHDVRGGLASRLVTALSLTKPSYRVTPISRANRPGSVHPHSLYSATITPIMEATCADESFLR
jgi:hypothetical protein